MRLANEGAIPQKPQDILHTPYVLEFAGLEDKASYHESDLESAVIEKMQKFLLELGKGFLFEQRQKKFTFHAKNFYVDLTLPENANIYAKEYKLYLPDKKLLQKKLKEWLDEEQKNSFFIDTRFFTPSITELHSLHKSAATLFLF